MSDVKGTCGVYQSKYYGYLADDFWGHVARSTTKDIQFTIFGYLDRESKIDQLDIAFGVKKDVLHFDVPMSDIVIVEILHC